MANIIKLGQLITEPAERDAVHIAVLPVVANSTVSPSDHVGVINGKADVRYTHVGIVDPFLEK